MNAYICQICGSTYEGETSPGRCPACHSAESFVIQTAEAPLDLQLSELLQQCEEPEEQANAMDRTECEKIKNT